MNTVQRVQFSTICCINRYSLWHTPVEWLALCHAILNDDWLIDYLPPSSPSWDQTNKRLLGFGSH